MPHGIQSVRGELIAGAVLLTYLAVRLLLQIAYGLLVWLRVIGTAPWPVEWTRFFTATDTFWSLTLLIAGTLAIVRRLPAIGWRNWPTYLALALVNFLALCLTYSSARDLVPQHPLPPLPSGVEFALRVLGNIQTVISPLVALPISVALVVWGLSKLTPTISPLAVDPLRLPEGKGASALAASSSAFGIESGLDSTAASTWSLARPTPAKRQDDASEARRRLWQRLQLSRGELLVGWALLVLFSAAVAVVIGSLLRQWPTVSNPIAAPWGYAVSAAYTVWIVILLVAVTAGVARRLPPDAWRSWPFTIGALTLYGTGLAAVYTSVSHVLPGRALPPLPALPPTLDAIASLESTLFTGLLLLLGSLLILPLQRRVARKLRLPADAPTP